MLISFRPLPELPGVSPFLSRQHNYITKTTADQTTGVSDATKGTGNTVRDTAASASGNKQTAENPLGLTDDK